MTPFAPGVRVPAPPPSLECNIFTFPAGTIIHRVHDERFGAADFNPGLGHSRFAPFAIGGTKVPTAYGATSLECAVFETIFHEIAAAASFKSVRWSAIEPLMYSTLELVRELRLAPLFFADLMKLGLERNQLIDTPKSTYVATHAWSPAIHAAPQSPEGIVWVSRRFDEEKALMLFGSRVSAIDLEPIASVKIIAHAPSLKVVADLAERAGIVIVR